MYLLLVAGSMAAGSRGMRQEGVFLSAWRRKMIWEARRPPAQPS